jgi:hypothetical protein
VTNVPTDRRANVRVLLRGGQGEKEGRQRQIAGYLVLILGPANASDWPKSGFTQGDLEAVVWTTPRQVIQVVTNLKADPAVVDARGQGDAD